MIPTNKDILALADKKYPGYLDYQTGNEYNAYIAGMKKMRAIWEKSLKINNPHQ